MTGPMVVSLVAVFMSISPPDLRSLVQVMGRRMSLITKISAHATQSM